MGGSGGVGKAVDVRSRGGGAAVGVGEDEVGKGAAVEGFSFFFLVVLF